MPDVVPDERRLPEDGVALCLSGGGYRAMLFHVGALWRLNELGFLRRIDRVSSVSGGSITAACLGLHWRELGFDAAGVAQSFEQRVVAAIRGQARRTIDVGSVLRGVFWRGSVGEKIAAAYREGLFGDATLQDLPADDEGPRFVINAANLQSGALWRFSRPYMRDWRVGKVRSPQVSLAVAVAASSAFPPFLSPLRLPIEPGRVEPGSGHDLEREPYTREVVLSDGGVYDNLGLETVVKRYTTLLVSDGGGQLDAEEKPKGDWLRQLIRVVGVIDNQVRSLRKRDLIDLFRAHEMLLAAGLPPDHQALRLLSRQGTFWGIRTDIADYRLADALPCPPEKTRPLAEEPTRLAEVDDTTQERLINWGYAVCDAALRKHVDDKLPPPQGWPYPGGVG